MKVEDKLQVQATKACKSFTLTRKHPAKKPRKQALSKADKLANQQLAKERITVEHVIRKLKVFRILKETYRNRRRRFGLRLNLIAAIVNFDRGL